MVLQNPAAGNYEELGDLYLDEGKFARAVECYDKAITPRTTDIDPVYRRGVAKVHLGDFAAAIEDLESVTSREPKYDSHRAVGLLAHAYANAGQPGDAESSFQRATELSTLSETYFNYASFLAAQKRAGGGARSGPSESLPRNPPCRDTSASRASVVPQGGRTVEAASSWRLTQRCP